MRSETTVHLTAAFSFHLEGDTFAEETSPLIIQHIFTHYTSTISCIDTQQIPLCRKICFIVCIVKCAFVKRAPQSCNYFNFQVTSQF